MSSVAPPQGSQSLPDSTLPDSTSPPDLTSPPDSTSLSNSTSSPDSPSSQMSGKKDLSSGADTKQDIPKELSLGEKIHKMFAESEERWRNMSPEERDEVRTEMWGSTEWKNWKPTPASELPPDFWDDL